MGERRIKRLVPFNDTQPAMIRLFWILLGGSVLALVLCGSVLAASWLQPSNVAQILRSPGQTLQRQQVSPTSTIALSPVAMSTASAIPVQLTTLMTPVPPPNQAGAVKPTLVATTTVTVRSSVPVTHIRATPGSPSADLSVTMYFPSGYAIPAGESLTFNDIISNAPGAGKTTGPITLSQTIPAGLNAIKAFGTGWTITAQPTRGPGNLKAIYTNTVVPGDSIPPLTIFGIIARNASPVLHMSATVSTTGNNGTHSEESNDDVTVMPPLTVTSP